MYRYMCIYNRIVYIYIYKNRDAKGTTHMLHMCIPMPIHMFTGIASHFSCATLVQFFHPHTPSRNRTLQWIIFDFLR